MPAHACLSLTILQRNRVALYDVYDLRTRVRAIGPCLEHWTLASWLLLLSKLQDSSSLLLPNCSPISQDPRTLLKASVWLIPRAIFFLVINLHSHPS